MIDLLLDVFIAEEQHFKKEAQLIADGLHEIKRHKAREERQIEVMPTFSV